MKQEIKTYIRRKKGGQRKSVMVSGYTRKVKRPEKKFAEAIPTVVGCEK